jgi:cystathionine gamma-synthase
MASVILNPTSPYHSTIQSTLKSKIEDRLHPHDALVLAANSHSFLPRLQKLNSNSQALLPILQNHPLVKTLYYPSLSPTKAKYDSVRRPNGGYGFLMSILFWRKEDAIAFLDRVQVAKGPNLGTEFTLACAYTVISHMNEFEWVCCVLSCFRR